uniref:peptidylprolyl isomerase n=1 Tax=Paramoeba aestuarina TaxID=180227 RepID=A0A6U3A411_9EUKA
MFWFCLEEETVKNKKPMGYTRTVLKEGTGRTPKNGEVIKAHYIGRLKSNGKEFDNSRARNKPLTFIIGIGSVIRGWDEGIMEMKLGETCTLEVSSDYGYGEEGLAEGGIPPNADLVFEVQLLQCGDDEAPSSGCSSCVVC